MSLKKKTKMQSTQLTQVRDRRRDTAYDDGRYLHSSWNRSDGARKFSVGIVSPRALPKTYEHRSVLAPSCLSSNRAWKPPQGCYSVIYMHRRRGSRQTGVHFTGVPRNQDLICYVKVGACLRFGVYRGS